MQSAPDTASAGKVDLLGFTPAGGCGGKLPREKLEQLLSRLDPLLSAGQVGSTVRLDGTSRDDAGIYALSPELLLAATVDFGTPVSADPCTWGRIGALNSLSDVYAMGAEPLFALAILGWPSRAPAGPASDVAAGAARVLAQERVGLVGGHTISSDVPLFGLCVIGRVGQNEVMRIGAAERGQVLILTKPLGTGVVTAAQKLGIATAEATGESERVMLESNRVAARLAVEAGTRAATDVSGYGLLGHLHNMASRSGCSAVIHSPAVPMLTVARRLVAEQGIVPNSAEANFMSLESMVDWGGTAFDARVIMADPQTSGGLLLAVDQAAVNGLLTACTRSGQFAAPIGRIGSGPAGTVRVVNEPMVIGGST